jgi:hypothetical protein
MVDVCVSSFEDEVGEGCMEERRDGGEREWTGYL